MNDILDSLVDSAKKRLQAGYYEVEDLSNTPTPGETFVYGIRAAELDPVIAEIKPASPSQGNLMEGKFDPEELTELYLKGGAAGFSVLTDPDHFNSNLDYLKTVSGYAVPTLMKDFVLDSSQIEAAKKTGADAVLLIYRLFERDDTRFKLDEAINHAREIGLEVLLEVNNLTEYRNALETEADMIGINNRDLRSLEIDLTTTKEILGSADKDRIVWSMSGISDREDINYLRKAGADAFLVGTSLTRAPEPVDYLRKLRGKTDG